MDHFHLKKIASIMTTETIIILKAATIMTITKIQHWHVEVPLKYTNWEVVRISKISEY